ncbi:MAG: hypothetical protein B6I20_13325 [Bacteroidetes bacterium 4572_117]|nr:MAG: hypothetical protein B6I20_13325 [Bacteroidetes bacterium 4572_117]
MKQTGIAIMVLFLVVTACKKESDMHSFFRRANDKNLKTLYDGEFYSFAAADSSLIRADYFLNVQGEITSYGDTIIAYGHCWSKTNTNPSIGHDHDTIIIGSSLPGITLTFPSYISGLESDTEYSIRSFAIFGDAQGNPIDTGYNPIVSQIATLPAIDEWFVKEGGDLKPQGARFDAISFNLGDTIFFGTGDQGNRNPTKDIWMYDPTKSKWEEIGYVNAIRLPVIGEYNRFCTDFSG